MRYVMTHGCGPGYLYFMAHAGLVKVGFSTCPEMRIYDFTGRHQGITLLHVIATSAMRFAERLTHWELRDYHVSDRQHEGEEWFKIPAEVMVTIRGIIR